MQGELVEWWWNIMVQYKTIMISLEFITSQSLPNPTPQNIYKVQDCSILGKFSFDGLKFRFSLPFREGLSGPIKLETSFFQNFNLNFLSEKKTLSCIVSSITSFMIVRGSDRRLAQGISSFLDRHP